MALARELAYRTPRARDLRANAGHRPHPLDAHERHVVERFIVTDVTLDPQSAEAERARSIALRLVAAGAVADGADAYRRELTAVARSVVAERRDPDEAVTELAYLLEALRSVAAAAIALYRGERRESDQAVADDVTIEALAAVEDALDAAGETRP